jgi:Putative Ig domain
MPLLLALLMFSSPFASTLQITTTSVPNATQYQAYGTTLAATGGTLPYTWSVVSSTGTSLPEGMSLNPSTGAVSATQVNGQGGYAVTIQVADSTVPVPNTATATINFGVFSDAGYGGCQMFPIDSIYNQRVDALPVDTNPAHQIPANLLAKGLHPDFGHGFYPTPGGIPFMRVASNGVLTNVNLQSGGQIDQAGPYFWPFPPYPNAVMEGTSFGQAGSDHHTLILESSVPSINGPQTGPCTLYEAYSADAVPNMYNAATSTWTELAASHYVLNSDEIAASTATLDNGAQDSPGIPIVPLLIRYNEVPLGVNHPLRITMPGPTNWFVWPGTGCCTGSGNPQGLLYRLKASINWQAVCPVTTHPQAATLLQALQQYGAYMSDHGSAGFIQGVPDIRWDDNDLSCIKNIPLSDLEVVDNSVLEINSISGQTKPYITTTTLPSPTVGTPYSAALGAVGGNPPNYQWTVTSGRLPAGLTLNATTGVISGTPIAVSATPFASSMGGPLTSRFTILLTDTADHATSQAVAFTVTVMPKPR